MIGLPIEHLLKERPTISLLCLITPAAKRVFICPVKPTPVLFRLCKPYKNAGLAPFPLPIPTGGVPARVDRVKPSLKVYGLSLTMEGRIHPDLGDEIIEWIDLPEQITKLLGQELLHQDRVLCAKRINGDPAAVVAICGRFKILPRSSRGFPHLV